MIEYSTEPTEEDLWTFSDVIPTGAFMVRVVETDDELRLDRVPMPFGCWLALMLIPCALLGTATREHWHYFAILMAFALPMIWLVAGAMSSTLGQEAVRLGPWAIVDRKNTTLHLPDERVKIPVAEIEFFLEVSGYSNQTDDDQCIQVSIVTRGPGPVWRRYFLVSWPSAGKRLAKYLGKPYKRLVPKGWFKRRIVPIVKSRASSLPR